MLEAMRLKGKFPFCPSRNFLNLISGGAALQAPLSPLPSPHTLHAPGPTLDPHPPPLLTLEHLFSSCLPPDPSLSFEASA